MTGVQQVDKKKKADDELQTIVDELKAIDESLNVRLDNIKKMLKIKRLIIQLFDRYTLEVFETQIKSYKIVFEEISTTIDEGKKEDKSSSEIISRLAKINLDVEYKDQKARIERSSTLEKLHLSVKSSASELKATIANCRNNTLDDHNNELKNKLTVTQDVLDETLNKNKQLESENGVLVGQIQSQSKEIQELKAENIKKTEQYQLLVRRLSKVEEMIAVMVNQSQALKPDCDFPSSSLSDSDIEVTNMPDKKHS
ncbi:hypothetical protein [Candidatus Mesenet endosymbiont of Phosphuga atrata]|uniref:hypothetical protein n=1 Tax=Candidatus Mesenet endosymbiont of Phosphuga atrata TaxID=3066221 RepID=UPI0030CFC977